MNALHATTNALLAPGGPGPYGPSHHHGLGCWLLGLVFYGVIFGACGMIFPEVRQAVRRILATIGRAILRGLELGGSIRWQGYGPTKGPDS